MDASGKPRPSLVVTEVAQSLSDLGAIGWIAGHGQGLVLGLTTPLLVPERLDRHDHGLIGRESTLLCQSVQLVAGMSRQPYGRVCAHTHEYMKRIHPWPGGTRVGHPEGSQPTRSSRTTTDLEVGVLLTSATLASGTSTFVSGK